MIGKRIKEARKALGMTQKEFAGRIRIGDSSLSKIEKGINKPAGRTVEMICLKFGINEKWIMEGTGGMMENASEERRTTMDTKDIINMLQEALQQAIDEKEGKNGEPDDTKLGEMAKGLGEILHGLEDRMIEKAPEREQLVLRLPVRAERLTDLLCDTIRALGMHEQGREEPSDEAVEAAELLHAVFDQLETGLENVLEICPWLEGDENGHF